ncbi:MAG: TolC family protein, partial [Rhodoferax sp.]|nr:TolC family protein [Rhodoferax sp.]
MNFRRHPVALLVSVAVLCPPFAHAQSFPDLIEKLLVEHHLAKMVDADTEAAKAQVQVEKSALFPKIGVQSSTGRQDISRDGAGASGNFNPSESSLNVNQLLFDFGATASRVRAAEAGAYKETLENILQKQNLVLSAVEAQIGLIKAEKNLQFALDSEANIKRQTQLESARMEAGRGYATDVLQAKAQLAGAEARRVVAKGGRTQAEYRYQAVFNRPLDRSAVVDDLAVPESAMPRSLAELEQVVTTANPDIATAQARIQMAAADRAAQHDREYMPRFDLQLSRTHSSQLDGVEGSRNDNKAQVRFNLNFDTGMRGRHVVNAADMAVVSASEKAAFTQLQALEDARNAWNGWQVAKEKSSYLANQVEILSSFLALARKERELGRRSLLDILSSETTLINTQSDAVSARYEEVVAAYRVLRAAGKMSVELFRQPGVVVSMQTPRTALAVAPVAPVAPSTESAQVARVEPVASPAIVPTSAAAAAATPVTAAQASAPIATAPRAVAMAPAAAANLGQSTNRPQPAKPAPPANSDTSGGPAPVESSQWVVQLGAHRNAEYARSLA